MNLFIGESVKFSSFSFLQTAFEKQFGKMISKDEVGFRRYGKPYFLDPSKPYFNISHSGKYIVCVFCELEIGVDIQRIKKIPDRVTERYLHTSSKDLNTIILEWTKFESYGKMIGCGIPYAHNYDEGQFLHYFGLKDYIITVCYNSGNIQVLKPVFIDAPERMENDES